MKESKESRERQCAELQCALVEERRLREVAEAETERATAGSLSFKPYVYFLSGGA